MLYIILFAICALGNQVEEENLKLKAENKALLKLLKSFEANNEESVGGVKSNGQLCESNMDCDSRYCNKNGRSRYTWKCATDEDRSDNGALCERETDCKSGYCNKNGRSRYTWKCDNREVSVAGNCQKDTDCGDGQYCQQNGRSRYTWRCAPRTGHGIRTSNKYKKCGSRGCKDQDHSRCGRGSDITTSQDKSDIRCPSGFHILNNGWCNTQESHWMGEGVKDTVWWAICGADSNSCAYNHGLGC